MSRRDRLISGILSVAVCGASHHFLSAAVRHPSSPGDQGLIALAISSLNISILFAWLAADLPGGVVLTVLSIGIAGLFNLRTDFYGSPLFILQFFCASLAGYAFFTLRSSVTRSGALRLEKALEERNALMNARDERRRGIGVLAKKVVGYSVLKSVVESFSSVLGVDEISALILDRSLETIGKKGRALIYLVDVEKQELSLAASRNESRVKEKRGDVFDRWVLRHRRSLLVEDVERDFRFPSREAGEASRTLSSLIASPLMSEDKVVGVVRIDSVESGFFTQDDLRLLDIIADLGAVALQNSYLYAKTQELAIRDGLTGLFVRRYFMDRFGKELKRVALKQGMLAVLILDIDHFKDYNDRYGHTAGDLVLKHLAGVVGSMAREGDIVARYGGEEIVIVLSGRDRAQAVAEAEALRRAIAERPFDLRRHQTRITASIGVAHYPEDALSEESLLHVADARLYAAKRLGRDRVCST